MDQGFLEEESCFLEDSGIVVMLMKMAKLKYCVHVIDGKQCGCGLLPVCTV